jgi:hypothetical protein
MAKTAIDPVIPCVMLVAELHGLISDHALICDVG